MANPAFKLVKADYNTMEYDDGYKIEFIVRDQAGLEEALAAIQGVDAYSLTYHRVQVTF